MVRRGGAGIICERSSAIRNLRHRGPDDEGTLSWSGDGSIQLDNTGSIAGDVILFHTRLAVIDLTRGSRQPFVDDSGRYAICYNGEIYNYLELRQELEGSGCIFRTTGDVEVALLAYRTWGTRAFEKFEGMFALAILDLVRGAVVLARDFAGIKPLYTALNADGSLAFASEIPALVEMAGLERRADPHAVARYIVFGITDGSEQTLWSGVKSLRPGTWISVPIAGGEIEAGEYWRLPQPLDAPPSFAIAAKQVRERFLESVGLHLRSDVPIGITLSGGIDSSAVAGALKRLNGAAGQVTAYGFASGDPKTDETKWMRMAAAASGIELKLLEIDESSFWSDLQNVVRRQGEPFATLSVLAQYYLFRQMRTDGIKVSLGGQGADETFGGYPNAFNVLFYTAARRQDPAAAMRWALSSAGRVESPFKFLLNQYKRYRGLVRISETASRHPVSANTGLREDWCRDHDLLEVSPPSRLLARDLNEYQQDLFQSSSMPRLLRYEDRNAMEHGIENRVPFVYRPLIEIARSVPEDYHVGRFGQTKKLLRAALHEFLPPEIAARKDKVGFFVSDDRLLRRHAEQVTEQLGSLQDNHVRCLNGDFVLRHWKAVLAGEQPYAPIIWRWINLARWINLFGIQA